MEFLILMIVVAGMFLFGIITIEVVGRILEVICDAEDVEDELLEK